MTNPANSKAQQDRALWIAFGVVMLVYIAAMAANGAIHLGETMHDAFCPEHGWAVTAS